MRVDTAVWRRVIGQDRRNWFVIFVAGWEFMTLVFPRDRFPWLPRWWLPWTRYFYRWRVHKWKRLGLWLVLGWLVEHVFGEERCVHVTVVEPEPAP